MDKIEKLKLRELIEVQRCIIHQIRNSTRYISYKDLKAFTADLKPIYKASDEALGNIGFG